MHWRLSHWQPSMLPMIINQLVSQFFHYNPGQHGWRPSTFENNWQLDKIFFGTMYKAFRKHNRSGICPVIHWTYPMMTYDTTCYIISNDIVRPEQNGRHFADGILNYIFLKEICCISIKISLRFVPQGSIDDMSAFVQIMACCQTGNKESSEPLMIILQIHSVTGSHCVILGEQKYIMWLVYRHRVRS